MTRIIEALSCLFVFTAIAVAWGCGENRDGEQRADDGRKAVSSARDSLDERTAALAEKNGGFPIDIALSQATSERQKERIRDRLAYQSQSREDAAARAAEKRAEIERKLEGELSDTEREKLERQLEALNRIVSDLE